MSWTVSSRGNHELGVLLKLNADGLRSVWEWLDVLDAHSEDLQEDRGEELEVDGTVVRTFQPMRGRNTRPGGKKSVVAA